MFTMMNFLLLIVVIITMSSFHPFFLSQSLVIFALITGGNLWYLGSVWLFVSVMMIFLGGVMITILYLSSLMNNEKSFFFKKKEMLTLGGFAMLFVLVPAMSQYNNYLMMNKYLYLDFYFYIFMYLIFYLFISLLGVVKVSQNYRGGLKKF